MRYGHFERNILRNIFGVVKQYYTLRRVTNYALYEFDKKPDLVKYRLARADIWCVWTVIKYI